MSITDLPAPHSPAWYKLLREQNLEQVNDSGDSGLEEQSDAMKIVVIDMAADNPPTEIMISNYTRYIIKNSVNKTALDFVLDPLVEGDFIEVSFIATATIESADPAIRIIFDAPIGLTSLRSAQPLNEITAKFYHDGVNRGGRIQLNESTLSDPMIAFPNF